MRSLFSAFAQRTASYGKTHNAFRLTSATSGGGDEHVANDDNDGRNADSDDADSMDSTRTRNMTAVMVHNTWQN